ncbi:PaaX family transcriptional regulator C-terminal domain-containing protein [Shimia haliotis]|uniref:Transcriptional regulator, PaaX family n=1 Tax=Shimia haliotis TaxID=1280847 RepID=A0A1I4E680_9RHOB|nr:PaaX family transcriptional regulator C-terminal domain-containing protein [Shimia haliotis]SFL01275.1 transcriptional regulator, PaaX family [Shimia haliotis]
MEASDLKENITKIAGLGPIKVWSVVVTVMGDLLRDKSDSLSAQQLDALVAPMGINNQALRVAVHRLRNDGWVETTKDGRRSRHQLTRKGRAQTESVWPHIYGSETDQSPPVWMVVASPQTAAPEFSGRLPKDSALLTPRSALVTGLSDIPEEWLAVPAPIHMPEWAQMAVAPEGLCTEYKALAHAVAPLLQQPTPTETKASTSLRLVILHQWRRLRLRHGALPDLVLGDNWDGAQCRSVVLEALKRFPRPVPSSLE